MRVVLHGNCQAMALGLLLRLAEPSWRVRIWEAHLIDLDRELDLYRADVAAADVVICQPIQRGFRGEDALSIDYVREHAARTITFPAMGAGHRHLSFLWGLNEAFPFVDAHAIDAFMNDVDPEDYVENVLRKDFMSTDFVLAEWARSQREVRLRDLGCDIGIEALIDRSVTQFWAAGRPKSSFDKIVARRLLDGLGSSAAIPATVPDSLDGYATPVLPSIARALGGQADLMTCYVGEWFDFPTQTRRVFAEMRRMGKEAVGAAMDLAARKYLARYAAAHS